ncbi:MAG: hypothetical protein LUG93_03385 [Lachnospiraceae bacterium]|nr:hypothetical protein [Lachnospiraceae bacterium]
MSRHGDRVFPICEAYTFPIPHQMDDQRIRVDRLAGDSERIQTGFRIIDALLLPRREFCQDAVRYIPYFIC